MRNLKIVTEKSSGVEGEIVPPEATLTSWEMSDMNRAREAFDCLESLLLRDLLPALGGYQNPVCKDFARHLEVVRMASHNFWWKHHAVGAAYAAKEVRP
ncbi:hypothetical protein D9M71_621430 [compost metagenome]